MIDPGLVPVEGKKHKTDCDAYTDKDGIYYILVACDSVTQVQAMKILAKMKKLRIKNNLSSAGDHVVDVSESEKKVEEILLVMIKNCSKMRLILRLKHLKMKHRLCQITNLMI